MSELPPSPPSSTEPEVATTAQASAVHSQPIESLSQASLEQHATSEAPVNAEPPPTAPIDAPAPIPAEPSARKWSWRLPESLDSKEFNLKLIVGLLAFLLGLQWWSSRNEISDLRRELAQRLQSGDNMNIQTKLIANRVDDELKLVQGKVAVLEAKQVESQGQQMCAWRALIVHNSLLFDVRLPRTPIASRVCQALI